MILEITGRHGSLSDALKEHADKKLRQALRHSEEVVSAHLVLDVEKNTQVSEIVVHGRKLTAMVHAESEDAWAAVDRSVDKLRAQLERHRSRRVDRKKKRASRAASVEAELAAIAQGREAEGVQSTAEPLDAAVELPRPRRLEPASMSVLEACSALDDGAEDVVLFRDPQTRRLNVLYEARDGELRLLETEEG